MAMQHGNNLKTLIANLKVQNASLRTEAQIQRVRLSTTINEMIAYCEAGKDGDALLDERKPNPNPFKPASRCTIL